MSKSTKYVMCKARAVGYTIGKPYRIASIDVDDYGLATYHVINDYGFTFEFGPEFFEIFETAIA